MKNNQRGGSLICKIAVIIATLLFAACDVLAEIDCAGDYAGHLQGIAVDDGGNIYWSFTTTLVKTDSDGVLLATVPVPTHYGDLTWVNNKIYVAVNHGQFNQEPGQADSWVCVHDDTTLALLEKHTLPEVVHGAGGMEWYDGRFFVIGGLPLTHTVNYVYEYTSEFTFVGRHEIASGYTTLGIQSVCRDRTGIWWFGCYGSPAVTLATDDAFKLLGQYPVNAAYGLARTEDSGKMLVGKNRAVNGRYGGSAYSLVMPTIDRPLADGVGADSNAIRVYTSPQHNRAWMTVHTNEVALRLIWPVQATHAQLKIAGMSSSFSTNVNKTVTHVLWRAVPDSAQVTDDVCAVTLTFYDEERPIATDTAQLAVLSAVFGGATVNPGPAGGAWSRVKGSVVIPYDSRWLEESAELMLPKLTITKAGQSGLTVALTEMSGYFGWELQGDGWGYGQFDLRLIYGVEQVLDAAVTRVSAGLVFLVR